MATAILRANETYKDAYYRCHNITIFNCTEEEFLLWTMGPRRLPLMEIIPITIVLVVIFLTGVIGNVATCVVIVRHPAMHTATNYYLFSLAASDLLLLLFGLPNELSFYWHQYPYTLGAVFCKLRALISEGSSYVSVLTIVAFSLERYLAICHPLHLYAMAGLKRAIRIVAALWVLSMLCAAPFAYYTKVSYHEYPPGSRVNLKESAFCGMLEQPSWALYEMSSLCFFIIPGLAMIYLYTRIGLRIRSTQGNSDNFGALNGVNGSVHGERQARSRKAIIRMLASVVIAFFVCWAPFHFQRLFYVYGQGSEYFNEVNEYLFSVTGALYYVSATVNPILYNVMSHRYRVAFRETLFCRKIRKGSKYYRENSSCRDTTPNHYSEATELVRMRSLYDRRDRIPRQNLVLEKTRSDPFARKNFNGLNNNLNVYVKNTNGVFHHSCRRSDDDVSKQSMRLITNVFNDNDKDTGVNSDSSNEN